MLVPAHPTDSTAAQHLRMLTMTDASGGVTPGGLCIPNPTQFARVRGEFAAAGLGSVVDLAGWAVSRLERVDLVMRSAIVDGAAILAVADALADAPTSTATSTTSAHFDGGLVRVRARAAELGAASLALEPHRVVADLIGAGPGTTPTGDDMLVGCLAALAVLGRADAASALSRVIAPLLETTTSTSRHYLEAAASGRFAEHVHDLVAGFAAGDSAERMLEHANRWGATSGVDLLIGMTATLRADLRVDLAARFEEGAA